MTEQQLEGAAEAQDILAAVDGLITAHTRRLSLELWCDVGRQ